MEKRGAELALGRNCVSLKGHACEGTRPSQPRRWQQDIRTKCPGSGHNRLGGQYNVALTKERDKHLHMDVDIFP